MIGPSKVLTVSYGTFSCTLEGFDDSFETMKAIAEYFRDLAADDRYFGAEPPQLDTEMMTRIAERQTRAPVTAQRDGQSVTLRPAASVPARPVATPQRAPRRSADSESIAAKLARIRAAVQHEEDEDIWADNAEPFSLLHPSQADQDARDNAEILPSAEAPRVGPQPDTPATEPAEAQETQAPAPQTTLPDPAPAAAQPAAEDTAEPASPADQVQDAPQTDSEAILTEGADDATPDSDADSEADDESDVDLSTLAAVTNALSAAPAETFADTEDPEQLTNQQDSTVADSTEDTLRALLAAQGDAEAETQAVPETAETSADAANIPADAPAASEPGDDAPAAAVSNAAANDVAEAETATAEETPPPPSVETALQDPEPQEATKPQPGSDAEQIAEDAVQPPVQQDPVAEAQPVTDDVAASDAPRTHVIRVRRPVQDIPIPQTADTAPGAIPADPEPQIADAQAPGAPAATGDLIATLAAKRAAATSDADADMDRLMSTTEEAIYDPDLTRRREALSHLKAAVAATEAARELGDTGAPDEDSESIFRDDLSHAVEPGRPALLRLVPSQRVDAAPITTKPADAVPQPSRIMPRRIGAALQAAAAAAMLDELPEIEAPAPSPQRVAAFQQFCAARLVDSPNKRVEAAVVFLCDAEQSDRVERSTLRALLKADNGEDIAPETLDHLMRPLLRNQRLEIAEDDQIMRTLRTRFQG